MLRYILGPSPLVSTITTIRKLNSNLSFRGGSTEGQCFSVEISYEFLENLTDSNKPERLTQSQLQKILSTNAKKLTKQQRLLKSVLDEANLSRTVSAQNLKNLEEVYQCGICWDDVTITKTVNL